MSIIQDGAGIIGPANTVDAVTPVFTGKNALAVAVASIALPAGSATAANQATEITSLQILDDVPSGMNAAFNKANPIAGQLDDAATTAATEDNVAPLRITPQRAVHINLRNQAGTETGTAAAPVRTDPTGTTTQPISAASLPLPAGAATAALQTQPGVDIGDVTINNAAGAFAVNVQDGGNSLTVDTTQLPAALVGGRLDNNIGAWLGSTAPTVGQKTAAASVPVVLASDQSAVPTTTTGGKSNNGGVPGATNLGVLPAVATAAAPTYTEGNQVAASTLLNGALRTDNTSWIGSTAPTVGQKAMASSVPVVIASDQSILNTQGGKTNNAAAPGATNIGAFTAIANAANPSWTEGNLVALSAVLNGHLRVREIRAATGTLANVAQNAASVTIMASNTARISGTIFNDSTSILYLKEGATASLTSFTNRLLPNASAKVENYTGIIDGIWAAAGAGAARVTENT